MYKAELKVSHVTGEIAVHTIVYITLFQVSNCTHIYNDADCIFVYQKAISHAKTDSYFSMLLVIETGMGWFFKVEGILQEFPHTPTFSFLLPSLPNSLSLTHSPPLLLSLSLSPPPPPPFPPPPFSSPCAHIALDRGSEERGAGERGSEERGSEERGSEERGSEERATRGTQ